MPGELGGRITRDWHRRVGLVLVVAAIAAFQHVTHSDRTHWHYIFPRVYYFPIVFAALYDGWREDSWLHCSPAWRSFRSSYTATICTPNASSIDILSPFLLQLPYLMGVYTDRERRQKRQYKEVASKLSDVYENCEGELRRHEARRASVGHSASLSAGLAHEVRNPLASISGAASILRRRLPADEKLERCVEIIESECRRLDGLLTNFLNFARPRSPKFQQTNLRTVLSHVIQLAEHALARKKIMFREQVGEKFARCAVRPGPASAGSAEPFNQCHRSEP